DEVAELLEQLALALGADHPLGRLAVLEHDQRGDAHHVEAASDLGVVVDVQLGDGELAGLLRGDLVEDGGDHLARPAPLGPEVDEDGLAGAGDHLVKGGVSESGGHGDSSFVVGPVETGASYGLCNQPPGPVIPGPWAAKHTN